MTIKIEAAFHEAGHAVVAHRSRFHNIAGPINLAAYGSGTIDISLSGAKLLSQGKAPTASAAKDKEVAVDLAVVLSAGLVAEQLAAGKVQGITANPKCAAPDHDLLQQELAAASLSKKFDKHEGTARQLLESEWSLVAALAAYLLEKISVQSTDVTAFIEQYQ